jgi:hypothetical protein
MKPHRILLAVFFACLFALPRSLSQSTSTQGREFWLSFMHNGFKDHTAGGWVINQVLISAKRDCTGTVENPLTGWSQSFSLSANGIATVEIPEQQGYHNSSEHERIYEKGIKVTASDTVSVYCTNIAHVSFDASFVLPVESLGDDYIVQCCEQSRPGHSPQVWNNETTAFVIVATEDNTVIDITPTVKTLGGHAANQTFSVTMHAGETYHVRSERITGNPIDLSGTRIAARNCKRIAVFNGNTITCVPADAGNGYDHVFEQAMPLRSWGKNFIVTTSMHRNRDFVKVTSSADGNIVTMNGETLDTLAAGRSYYFPMLESEGSCYLQTTQPSAVYLYNNSSHDRFLGDPSMVWIAPAEQRIRDVTFSTFDHPDINIEMHCVNIIVKTDDIGSVYFDGGLLPPSCFLPVNGNNAYSYARMDIAHGVHRISCDKGFNAHVYGFGDAKGYAYLAGSNANRLSTTVSVNGETVLPHEDYPFCPDREITFRADVNHDHYDLLWDFGDGGTSTENPAVHTYAGRRLYNASLLVATDEGGCWDSPGDTVRFNIDATQHYSIHDEDVCEGGLYTGYGFNDIPIGNDTVLAGLQDNPVHPECQDSVLVYITARHHVTNEFDTVLCGALVWDGSTYTETGDIVHTYPASNGCDSIVTCHLSVPGPSDGDTLTRSGCDSFSWNGVDYTVPGFYSDTVTTPSGCDSILHLDLSLTYSPQFDKIHCTTPDALVFGPTHDTAAVVTNTEYFSFQYTFQVKESRHPECVWDRCLWTISKPSWTIEFDTVPVPSSDGFGSECKVFVAEHDPDYVVLTATMSNGCGSDTHKFYLKPSFLDVNEHQAGFATIHPNPTTGRVAVTGHNLQRADVINILGQRVLGVQGKGDELQLDLSRLPAGVYTLRVTMEDGSVYSDKIVKE